MKQNLLLNILQQPFTSFSDLTSLGRLLKRIPGPWWFCSSPAAWSLVLFTLKEDPHVILMSMGHDHSEKCCPARSILQSTAVTVGRELDHDHLVRNTANTKPLTSDVSILSYWPQDRDSREQQNPLLVPGFPLGDLILEYRDEASSAPQSSLKYRVSLPFSFSSADTFASKVAATQDQYADASIGNVTGSNAVNVFLGIGVAWSIAAIYHAANGEQFKVSPGTLAFSVTLFTIFAFINVGVLLYRRRPEIGGELGGPRTAKLLTSCLFVLLWLLYIFFSSLEAYCHIKGF